MSGLGHTLAARARTAAGICEKSGGLTQVKDFSAGGVIIECSDAGITGQAVSHSQTTGRS